MVRSEAVELLDAGEVPEHHVALAYRELEMIHDWLGNARAVVRLLRADSGEPVRRVLDIGCGRGALLETIEKKLGVAVVGFDLRPAPASARVPILTGNAVTDCLPDADVAICVVMAHHLSEAEVVAMIGNVARTCRRFILLDLVRHPVPLGLFRIFIAPWLSRVSALDGQTSVQRAWTATEMRAIVDEALAACPRAVRRMRHTVGPLWIRQVVDICWEPT